MGLEEQGGRPSGKTGIFFGKMMNLFHTGFYKKYYSKILPDTPAQLLDIGCGGGRLIHHLSGKHKDYKVFGLDHSEEMVALSKKINSELISSGRVSIEAGSVGNLPFAGETMNIITANETVQFWPDIQIAFSEIYRVLKSGGNFFIINRYPPEGSKWRKIAKLKSGDDFAEAFKKAGFQNIEIDLETRKGWILTKTTK